MFIAPRLPNLPFLTACCQRFDTVGAHSVRERVMGRVSQGLGIERRIRRWLGPAAEPTSPDPLGASSQFSPGSWVRVRDQASIRQTLDERSCLGGIRFSPVQTATCLRVYRVSRVVRRILDEDRILRPVERTVLLEGAGAEGTGQGGREDSGRYAPLFYRDEWLEPSDPARPEPEPQQASRFARVRPLEQILGRLDLFGRRGGLTFMPEMGRYAGCRARVLQQLSRVLEYNRWVEVKSPLYVLEGMLCTGGILGSCGPCDCACPLLWHVDWLELDT